MPRPKNGPLTDKQRAILRGLAADTRPATIGEAMRLGGYSAREATRKALGKLKDMGLIDGYFGEMPTPGVDKGKNAAFWITSKGKDALA